jgi:hypothetical protein
MKYLLFIVLLVAVVITAGCVGGNQNSAVTPTPQIVYVTVFVTPTPTPTPTPTLQPPITYPSSLHYAGSSSREECFMVTGDTYAYFTINYRGSDTFTVIVTNVDMAKTKVLVMQSGPYYGYTTVPMTTGKYCYHIIAKTTWTIDIDFHPA